MRGAALIVLLLAGCSASSPPEPRHATEWTPYEPLAGTGDEPTRWQVHSVRGLEPSQLAVDGIREELDRVLGPGNHSMLPPQSLPWADRGREHIWTTIERFDLVKRLNSDWNGERRPIWVLFVDGGIQDEDGRWPRGQAVHNGAFVYKHQIENNWATVEDVKIQGQARDELERHTSVHEVGHVLGLVDHGIPMLTPRVWPDDSCRCHSRFEDSVMYGGGTGAGPLSVLEPDKGATYTFDTYDLADLAAARADALARMRGR